MDFRKRYDVLFSTSIGTFAANNILANSFEEAELICWLLYGEYAYVYGEIVEEIPIQDEELKELGLLAEGYVRVLPPFNICLN